MVRLFQRCRWQADGQSDILEQVEVPSPRSRGSPHGHRGVAVGFWGLERYVPAFRENEFDAEVLPELSEADLVTLGLPLGPRKKLLKAIAAMREDAVPSHDEPAALRPALVAAP